MGDSRPNKQLWQNTRSHPWPAESLSHAKVVERPGWAVRFQTNRVTCEEPLGQHCPGEIVPLRSARANRPSQDRRPIASRTLGSLSWESPRGVSKKTSCPDCVSLSVARFTRDCASCFASSMSAGSLSQRPISTTLITQNVVPEGHGRIAAVSTTCWDACEESIASNVFMSSPLDPLHSVCSVQIRQLLNIVKTLARQNGRVAVTEITCPSVRRLKCETTPLLENKDQSD
jgi:hypothetical protein